ncbi:hypothetical protein [Candidatus Albibeggiatoa sp. nov. NOAA]|uniref:hypothetical protein n=1 Tax=Candidatus Albibeggiatoa sp. nov. NOAA TaxID=3162724 RepID=UPI0032F30563|nr:hypothetical protein [Thiotrichaceae bacterium]
MRIENTLNIFATLIFAVSYIVLLLAFTLIENERMTYIAGGLGGLILGTVLLGFSRIVYFQEKNHQELLEMVRVQRSELRALNDMQKSTQNIQKILMAKYAPKQPAKANTKPAKPK